jgi:hypothetical protein
VDWWLRPAIRAEALQRVAEPLATALRAGPAAPREVVRAFVEAMQPPEAEVETPGWLLPEQRTLVRRCAAAIARHGGCLLAEPVGAGKTWMALALARVFQPDEPTPVLVPAPLRRQWVRIADSLGVRVHVGTHAAASRGRMPRAALCDHRRKPALPHHGHETPQHTARWLVNRRALLLSATPVVNRLSDLAAQLLWSFVTRRWPTRAYPRSRRCSPAIWASGAWRIARGTNAVSVHDDVCEGGRSNRRYRRPRTVHRGTSLLRIPPRPRVAPQTYSGVPPPRVRRARRDGSSRMDDS